ncbi:MAG: YhfC family intramembrane metalloprotease [Lachnospiraceae bacterium]|nr:YhfC family intramembrane metalloprotease [Lachnospiraceae bacterium]
MNTVMEWGTVSTASLIGMIFSLILSIGLPIVLLILVKIKLKANLTSFVIGCATFIVFALMLEPILHSVVLTATGTLLTDNIILYGLYGGLAAALFEETGRLIAMKFFMKESLNKQNSLMYGIGHGGIEAILLVGMTYISNLMTAFMINSGALQASLESVDAVLQKDTFQQVKLLWELPSWQFYMAGIERLIAVLLQIALSILVYKAVAKKNRTYWFIAFGIHFAVDFLTVVITGLGAPVWIVEVLLLIAVAFVAHYAYKLYKEEENV